MLTQRHAFSRLYMWSDTHAHGLISGTEIGHGAGAEPANTVASENLARELVLGSGICALDFSTDGSVIAVGLSNGCVTLVSYVLLQVRIQMQKAADAVLSVPDRPIIAFDFAVRHAQAHPTKSLLTYSGSMLPVLSSGSMLHVPGREDGPGRSG